jgi:hypothetical protein
MRTPRDRRASTHVDVYPQELECPGCQRVLKERYHKQRFFKRLLGGHICLGRDHADFSRLHSERFQKLPYLGRRARNPRQGFDPSRRLGYGRGRTRREIGLYRLAMVVESTA